MKIAINGIKGSFSDRWISYCEKNGIDFKIVDAYKTDIVEQIAGCDAFMWHHEHSYYKDILFAKQLLYSLEKSGIKVFPDFNTTWHFDDKVGQKYLLEAINAPIVPSYVFYSKEDALEWINATDFPKVFKLRRGSGSRHVQLIKSREQARKYLKTAFGKGFAQYDKFGSIKERIRKYKEGKSPFSSVLKGLVRTLVPSEFSMMMLREKGYLYFQDFIPNNTFDIRIIVVGSKAFGVKRYVRKDDFRASGSGNVSFDKEQIDSRCVKIAFDVNKHLKAQSIAFDFVFDKLNNPLIVEISYGYAISFYDPCPGYWDSSLNWYEGRFIPQEWMVENLIKNE